MTPVCHEQALRNRFLGRRPNLIVAWGNAQVDDGGKSWPKAIFNRSWRLTSGRVLYVIFDMGKTLAPVKFVEVRENAWPKIPEVLLATRLRDVLRQPKDRDESEHRVRNQKEHHQRPTFQNEYRGMLVRDGIEFDERDDRD